MQSHAESCATGVRRIKEVYNFRDMGTGLRVGFYRAAFCSYSFLLSSPARVSLVHKNSFVVCGKSNENIFREIAIDI